MTVVTADTAAILYTYLAAVADLASNGFNIYGPPGLPANWAGGKALVFWSDGGQGHDRIPLQYERVQFRVYGDDSQAARLGYRLLADALQRRGHSRIVVGAATYLLQYATLTSGPHDLVEPETRWPFVLAWYNVHFYERSV